MGQTANEDQERSISEGSQTPKLEQQERPSGKGRRRALTGFGFAMLLCLAFAIFFYANFTTIQVSGRSMFPTFHDGQRVLVSKAYWLVGPIRDKDVVVLRDREGGPNAYIIKRVYRMGGETVDWMYVPDSHRIDEGDYKVPNGCVYVLGDNLPESEDSRRFGSRPIEDILGKVIVRP